MSVWDLQRRLREQEIEKEVRALTDRPPYGESVVLKDIERELSLASLRKLFPDFKTALTGVAVTSGFRSPEISFTEDVPNSLKKGIDMEPSPLEQFAEQVANNLLTDEKEAVAKQGVGDPVIITIMIISVLIELYKICKSFPERQALSKPTPLWRWSLRRAAKHALRDAELERVLAQPLCRSILDTARGWNPTDRVYAKFAEELVDRVKSEEE